jgi:hypothetical protein
MPVMKLLWIILRVLFPTDPVRQCIEAARQRIALMVGKVFSPESLFLLAHDPRARLHIEALVIDYESALHFAIGARACQIAKMRFRQHPRAFFRPTRALSVERLLARIRALATMVNNIERLAQARAARLIRERDADPLGCCPLRHAAAQRATSPSLRLEEEMHLRLSSSDAVGGGGLRALARETEGAAATARAPPVFDVQLTPQPASQAHLRGRGPMRHSRLRRAFRPVCPRPHEMAPDKSIQTALSRSCRLPCLSSAAGSRPVAADFRQE